MTDPQQPEAPATPATADLPPSPAPGPPPPPVLADIGRDTAIVGHGITKTWGTNHVLDGASFAVGRGVTGLLGSNGAGKTTLFGMILGLHRADSGTLEVLGLDPRDAGPEIRSRIGYAPEHHMLPPDMKAHDLVRHIAEIHGLPRGAATTRASDALWQVGLGEERFRAIGTMSTGQRQRVKLAQALAHDPALLLLDEPTDGLDPVQRDDMLELIRKVGTEFGIDVVVSSHLLEEVERICDGVVILGGGRVVASGSLDSLRGESTGVVAEIEADVDAVAAQLTGVGWQASVEGTRLTVEVMGDVDLTLDAVRDAIANVGAPLRSLSPRRVSLEQIFLREVG